MPQPSHTLEVREFEEKGVVLLRKVIPEWVSCLVFQHFLILFVLYLQASLDQWNMMKYRMYRCVQDAFFCSTGVKCIASTSSEKIFQRLCDSFFFQDLHLEHLRCPIWSRWHCIRWNTLKSQRFWPVYVPFFQWTTFKQVFFWPTRATSSSGKTRPSVKSLPNWKVLPCAKCDLSWISSMWIPISRPSRKLRSSTQMPNTQTLRAKFAKWPTLETKKRKR